MDITTGDVRYDAAVTNMRSPWRMPNKDQLQELIDNTTNEWTTINGKNGRKFTNKSDSNKYIFLPAAGARNATTHDNANSFGLYWVTNWSSSSSSWYIAFNSNRIYMYGIDRLFGQSIRGIQ